MARQIKQGNRIVLLDDEALAERHKSGVRMSIFYARITQNITQKELAKRVGTKQEVISRIESDDSNPCLNTLVKIAVALGLEFDFKEMD